MEKLNVIIEKELGAGADISIINVVDHLLSNAEKMGASDIHIDPVVSGMRVRFRIDGVLNDACTLPKKIHNEIISRIKILSGLRTDEHNAAQDGRFRSQLLGAPGNIDIRVSIMPTHHGENVVLRILSDNSKDFLLEDLGFDQKDQEKIVRAIKKPSGMILVTGPTGSGKTTTLYTLIKMLNSNEISIITLEDPIEYAIENVEQIQVNHHAGLSFANGLRSVLRQDPDIIMVGEIRDTETAGIAINTALTGHLLLSTLHTNDAATTLPRLLDMRVEPFLVASTVNLVIGQRLVRKICDKCKTTKVLSDEEYKNIAGVVPENLMNGNRNFFYGEGCNNCNQTGFKGRIVISEVLVMNEDIRNSILRKESSALLKKEAVKNGMTTMLEDGVKKAMDGITTIEEVFRVTCD